MKPSNRILLGCVRSQCILGPIHCLHSVTLGEAHFHIDDLPPPPPRCSPQRQCCLLLMTITASLSLSPLCNGCKPGSVPVTVFTCGSRAVPTSGTAVVFEGCAFVDTALEEVWGEGTALTESKCEFFAAPSACTGAGAAEQSLGLKRSESSRLW